VEPKYLAYQIYYVRQNNKRDLGNPYLTLELIFFVYPNLVSYGLLIEVCYLFTLFVIRLVNGERSFKCPRYRYDYNKIDDRPCRCRAKIKRNDLLA
jgi:hypothetical protein